MAKVCECAMLTDQYLCFLFISAFSYLETLHSFYKTQCSSPKASFWFIVWQYITLGVNNLSQAAWIHICSTIFNQFIPSQMIDHHGASLIHTFLQLSPASVELTQTRPNNISLVTRPSLPPVFDHLQYINLRQGRPRD